MNRVPWGPGSMAVVSLWLAGIPACGETSDGAVMVVVTTDMLVPVDINALSWKVTIGGEAEPYQSGAMALKQSDLPATLAVVSGPKTTEPVVIELEGLLRQGEASRPRVRRTAELKVPKDGTKELAMPLSWLCSEANLPEPCPRGKTCQAGECVSQRIANPSSLPDHVADEGRSCFNVTDCFKFQNLTTARVYSDHRYAGSCAAQGTQTAAAPDVNVGLIVNTAAVGNYGVCGPWSQCLIPLDRDSPNGWRTLTVRDEPAAIGLPDQVCRLLGRTIAGVAIAPLANNGSCQQTKSTDRSLCTGESNCLAAKACPSGWPSAWTGYSCSAAESPELEDPLSWCWEAGAEHEPAPVPGLFCCTSGQSPPEATDPLLIDDMSGGPQIKLDPPGGPIGGFWWTFSDDTDAQLSPPPFPKLYTYRAIDPPATPQGGPTIEHAACLKYDDFKGWAVGMGFNFALDLAAAGDAAVTFDVRDYTGISFWAYSPASDTSSQEIEVHFPDQNTEAGLADSTCSLHPEEGECGDNWAVRGLTLTDTWTQYFVQWDELTQSPDDDWGARYDEFDQRHAYTLTFQVHGLGPDWPAPPYEFCVSHIYFTE